MRTERWRLVFPLRGKGENGVFLSDITQDAGEKRNLADQHPEVVAERTAAFDAWWKSTEPYLINEGLTQPSRWPLHQLYEKQRKSRGIPEWIPDP